MNDGQNSKPIIYHIWGNNHPLTSGWWYTYPSEKYESQLELFPYIMEK